jgi:PAS domain S-box-containing protein
LKEILVVLAIEGGMMSSNVKVTGPVSQREKSIGTTHQGCLRLKILRDIVADQLELRPFPVTAGRVLRNLRRIAPYRSASILSFEAGTSRSSVVVVVPSRSTVAAESTLTRWSSDPAIRAKLQRGEIFLSPAPGESRKERARKERSKSAAVLFAPLLHRGELLGSLELRASETGSFSRDQVELVSEVALSLASALSRLRRFETMEEASWRALAESSTELIVLVDDGMTIRFLNRAVPGSTREQLCGTSLLEWIEPVDHEVLQESLRRAFEGRCDQVIETPAIGGDGHRRYRIRLIPVHLREAAELVALVMSPVPRRSRTKGSGVVPFLRIPSYRASVSDARERRKIASELHDRILQDLGACMIKLRQLDPDGSRTGELRELLQQAIRETRALEFELSPFMLHEMGLEQAVETLAEKYSARYGFRCLVDVERKPLELGDDARVILFQSIRELLDNAGKHARATTVRVSIRCVASEVQYLVEDDGIGFDPTDVARTVEDPRRVGLAQIQERMQGLGGRLEIDSESGEGSRIRLWVPRTSEKRARPLESVGEASFETVGASRGNGASDRRRRLSRTDVNAPGEDQR